MIQPEQTYVLDRGSMEYQLVKDVDDRGAWLVVRAYTNIEVETIEELPVVVPDALNGHWTNVRDRIVRPKDPEFAHISFRLVECTVGTTTYRLITNLYQLTSDHSSVRISLADRAYLPVSQTYDARSAYYHAKSNRYSKLLLCTLVDSITPFAFKTALSCGRRTRSAQ